MCSLCLDVNVSFCPCVCLLIKTLFPKPTRITRESHRQTQKQCLPACLPAAYNQTPTPPPLHLSRPANEASSFFFFPPPSRSAKKRKRPKRAADFFVRQSNYTAYTQRGQRRPTFRQVQNERPASGPAADVRQKRRSSLPRQRCRPGQHKDHGAGIRAPPRRR